jgi:hypothetical protein
MIILHRSLQHLTLSHSSHRCAPCLTPLLQPCTSPAARYGVSRPPDIAAQYWRLANLPVELMAGSHDGIIPPVNVRKHYRAMAAAGLKVGCGLFEGTGGYGGLAVGLKGGRV